MNHLRKSLSVLLSATLLICFISVSAAAANPKQELWNSYWENSEEIDAAITVAPGSNEKERYISWYSSSNTGSVTLISPFGVATEYEAAAQKTAQGDYRLKVLIDDLLPESNYTYYCQSGNFKSNTYMIPATDSNSFTAMYVTDVHITAEDDSETAVRDAAYKFNETIEAAINKSASEGKSIDLILSAGDQATRGLREEYAGFTASPYIRSIPVATTIGNHDRKAVDYKYFTFQPNTADIKIKSYIGTDYWFIKDNVLFLVMDSTSTNMSGHRNFIKSAIEANPNTKWRVAMFHHDLYSGRIPHRESENEMLRMMWAPVADEFGIDLCLLGHSHYYTISNVLYNNKTVAKTENGAVLTNPKGTVYMVSGSVNHPRNDETIGLSENIGHAVLTDERIYNLIDFSENSITVNSYTVESDANIGSFTIKKTDNQGGHSYSTPAQWYYPVVEFVSAIVNIINNIGMYADYIDLGYDVPLIEGIFG